MNKVKDLLYDKNDILVALIILCIAVFVIFSRANYLMGSSGAPMFSLNSSGGPGHTVWGDNTSAGSSAHGNQNDQHVAGTDEDEDEFGIDDTNGENDNYDEQNEDIDETGNIDDTTENASQPATGPHSLYIASGQSVNTIGRNLVSLGIFDSERDFIDTLEAHNAATRIQVGTFIIPADATKEDVIRIITGR